jgi:ribonuclease P protein component
LEFLGEQADVPAEQSAPCEDARLPAADAHPRGPRHPCGAPAQGPHPAVGLSTPAVVLPAAARMRRRAEFAATVRGGSRAATPAVVAHWRPAPTPLQVGFVVGRGVGSAVTRNRVRRRLRHLVRERLAQLPDQGLLVVRANPAAAAAPALPADLDRALARVLARATGGPERTG